MYLQSEDLLKRLAFVQGGTMRKPFPEYYGQVLIEYRPEDHSIVARSFNGQSHFQVVLGTPEAKTVRPHPEQKNYFIFDPANILASYKRTKEQVFLHIDFASQKVVVKSQNTQATDTGLPCEGFNAIPALDIAVARLSVPEHFAQCIERCAWIIDDSATEPGARGVFIKHVSAEEAQSPIGWIEFCGTDRNVICVCHEYENTASVAGEGIVPLEAALTVAEMIRRSKDAEFYMDENHLVIVAGDYMMISTHLAGVMLAYNNVINAFDYSSFVNATMSRSQLMVALDFVDRYIDPEYKQIYFNFGDGEATLVATPKDKRKKGQYKIRYVGNAAGTRLCISIDKAKNCVKNLDTEDVVISFDADDPRALTIKPGKSEDIYTEFFTSASVPQDQQ